MISKLDIGCGVDGEIELRGALQQPVQLGLQLCLPPLGVTEGLRQQLAEASVLAGGKVQQSQLQGDQPVRECLVPLHPKDWLQSRLRGIESRGTGE